MISLHFAAVCKILGFKIVAGINNGVMFYTRGGDTYMAILFSS